MKSDIDRWNGKYSSHNYRDEIQADPLLTEIGPTLTGLGKALDLATGVGDNAVYLASLGYETYAIDGSISAIRLASKKSGVHKLGVHWFVADLDSYPLPHEAFDVVTVVKYLNRSLIGGIKNALKPGGLLFLKTFNERFRKQHPAFPEKYVLRNGELNRWFSDWECLSTNDECEDGETQSFWFGTKKAS